jgi:hypothetical protein
MLKTRGARFKTWVNCRWQYPAMPGHFSVQINTFDMERTLGFGTEHPLLYRPNRDPGAVLDRDPELAARVMPGWKRHLPGDDNPQEAQADFPCSGQALFEAQAMDETAVLQVLTEADISMGKMVS